MNSTCTASVSVICQLTVEVWLIWLGLIVVSATTEWHQIEFLQLKLNYAQLLQHSASWGPYFCSQNEVPWLRKTDLWIPSEWGLKHREPKTFGLLYSKVNRTWLLVLPWTNKIVLPVNQLKIWTLQRLLSHHSSRYLRCMTYWCWINDVTSKVVHWKTPIHTLLWLKFMYINRM